MRLFVWKGILKNTPLSSKIHCYVKNRNGLYLNRYRSNCKSVRFLLRASPKLVRKQGKVYLSSKHKRRGYLGWVRYQNMVLSSICPSVHATIHFIVLTRVRFTGLIVANLSFLLISRRIQDLQFM